jgi:hypothetical protein
VEYIRGISVEEAGYRGGHKVRRLIQEEKEHGNEIKSLHR